MKDHVKILLMGDDGVGKSSLLSAYISRHFPQEVPSVMTDAMIPPETTANNVTVTIMDSSSKIQERDQLKQKILQADSIIALYDVTRPETFDSLVQDWLPLIKEVLQIPYHGTSGHTSVLNSSKTGPGASSLSTSASTGGNNSGTALHQLAPIEPHPLTSAQRTTSTSSLPLKTSTTTTHSHVGSSTLNPTLGNNTLTTAAVNKPVIVLGTKVDLLAEDEDVEKLHSLLEQFPFVLLCWRCSAAKLQDVDQVFYFGELLVTFPLHPIFDVLNHEFTPSCRYAFQRIFRIFDVDGDNVLSDHELCESQLKCFDLAINQEELLAMKRQISKMVVGGIANNRVTFEGFLGLIKMIIENHQFQIPWTILRRFDYNDDLQLMIPKEVLTLPTIRSDQITELSEGAKAFLLSLAKNAYIENAKPMKADSDSCSEIEDCLTWEALKSILSVLPHHSSQYHPWAQPPSYKSIWPYAQDDKRKHAIEQSILLSGLPHTGANLSFDAWLTHWNLLALSNPILVQQLLYELGYAERSDLGIIASPTTLQQLYFQQLQSKPTLWNPLQFIFTTERVKPLPQRSLLRIAILGDNRVGKSSFVWHVSNLRPPGIDEEDVEKGIDYEKPLETIVIGGCMMSRKSLHHHKPYNHENGFIAALSSSSGSSASPPSSSRTNASSNVSSGKGLVEETQSFLPDTFQLSFAAIPLEHHEKWKETCLSSCDVVLLMFQCGDMESLETVMKLEKELPLRMPRLYIASKSDLLLPSSTSNVLNPNLKMKEVRQAHELVLQTITLHIQEHHLLPVLMTSTISNTGIEETMEAIRSVVTNPILAIPVEERKEKNPSYSKPLLLFTTAVTITSLSVLLVNYNKEVKEWFQSVVETTRSWFSLPLLTTGYTKGGI